MTGYVCFYCQFESHETEISIKSLCGQIKLKLELAGNSNQLFLMGIRDPITQVIICYLPGQQEARIRSWSQNLNPATPIKDVGITHGVLITCLPVQQLLKDYHRALLKVDTHVSWQTYKDEMDIAITSQGFSQWQRQISRQGSDIKEQTDGRPQWLLSPLSILLDISFDNLDLQGKHHIPQPSQRLGVAMRLLVANRVCVDVKWQQCQVFYSSFTCCRSPSCLSLLLGMCMGQPQHHCGALQ